MNEVLFRFDALSGFVGLFAVFFFVLIGLYSLEHMGRHPGRIGFWAGMILTLAMAEVSIFADNLLLFLVAWGILGLLLYLLISLGRGERAALTAKKAFVVVGAADILMLLGFGLLWRLKGETAAADLSFSNLRIDLAGDWTGVIAFLCLLSGALAKAGAFPFHSWVPDTAEDAEVPVTAYLPASLDKLLGIYLLARLVMEVFVLTPALHTLLMGLGAFTILAAVMMALVQHDLKRLLGYHAVSQVGYMVLGLGTGHPVGIAGGLFHMLNHAIYKSGLFLCAGNAERSAGTGDLARLGGLASKLPWTFASFLVASLAISGIPPLNGFASKWLVYQGVIQSGDRLWFLWLTAAMFGTALTLASFAKLLHAVFLTSPAPRDRGGAAGEPATSPERVQPGFLSEIPPAVLAFCCVVFGVLAVPIPLTLFILPAAGSHVAIPGLWDAPAATLLLLLALAVGLLPAMWSWWGKIRVVEPFIGGEKLALHPAMRVSGVHFYQAVERLPVLRRIYPPARDRRLDPYEVGKTAVLWLSRQLGGAHNGLLPRYVTWCLAGLLLLILALEG
jgi:formate hydrogenlyase subunit 3/multisubunit Na+/H+ antiporter MnhD subunit